MNPERSKKGATLEIGRVRQPVDLTELTCGLVEVELVKLPVLRVDFSYGSGG